ncbi:hypothetical protein TSAR_008318 [Trichomalopsis sarcophagae]|uniref:Ionotropic glutamate receptor L-glutamate and glycine-binding domain-containing protein n=1 Tax=Trichomalopsis sarcophagae TaxID=543379 RepID=A0A232FC16_9HYME|nr:hypothetical protein TSAR_008318 [Trichomalopsis sarcophagae]
MNVTKNMSTRIQSMTILMSILFGIVTSKGSTVLLRGLAGQLSRDHSPSQVTIFVNKTEESSISHQQDVAMKELMQMNPSAIIDVARFNLTDFNRTITYTSIRDNPRRVSIHVILLDENSDRTGSSFLEKVSQFLRFFVSMNHKMIRPKILLVYFSDEEVNQAFVDAMRFAWYCEFLDFSIVHLNPKNDVDAAYLHHYNPFFNTSNKSLYDTRNDLFVDKLGDVNLYPIRIMLTKQPPFMKFSFKTGKLKIYGIHFKLLKLATQKMHFKIKYVGSNVKALAHTTINEDSFNRLAQGHVDTLGVALSFIQSKCAKMSVGLTYYEDMVAIVPIVSCTAFHISVISILVYLLVIPAIILGLLRLSVYLRIVSINLDIFNVVQVLYGIPISHPRKHVDRIFFISLIFVSMQYSMYYYSHLLDGQILRQEMSFASFREIADSPMDIFINRKFVDRYLPIENPDVRRIRARITLLDDISECIEKIDTRSVICMASEYFAKYIERKHLNSKADRLVKIAPVSFSKELLVIYTKDAFPYTEKFQEIFQTAYEAGIWPSPFRRYQKMIHNKTTVKTENNQKDRLMMYKLGFMLTAGFGLLKGIIVSHQEVKFDSFREIADSPLNIFINRNYIRYLPKDSPETLRIGIDDMIYSCIQKLKTRSVICLTSQIYAEYLTEIQLENDGKVLFIYTKDDFPYSKKFQEAWERNRMLTEEGLILYYMGLMLVLRFLVSLLAFVREMLL